MVSRVTLTLTESELAMARTEGFEERVPERVPGRRGHAPRVLADGEHVAFRATETGIHEGEFMGIQLTGGEIEMEGTVIHSSRTNGRGDLGDLRYGRALR